MTASDWEDGFASSVPCEPASLPPARPRVRQRNRLADYPPAVPEVADRSGEQTEFEPTAEGSDAAYAVGYGKPPHHTRFQPGRSGNPKGRPKSAKGLKTMVRETMTKRVDVRTAGGATKMSRMEAVLHKTVELAMKGNARALAEIFKLYANAVPEEEKSSQIDEAMAEDLTETDVATLEELRRFFADTEGEGS
jgi:hypothetical protein